MVSGHLSYCWNYFGILKFASNPTYRQYCFYPSLPCQLGTSCFLVKLNMSIEVQGKPFAFFASSSDSQALNVTDCCVTRDGVNGMFYAISLNANRKKLSVYSFKYPGDALTEVGVHHLSGDSSAPRACVFGKIMYIALSTATTDCAMLVTLPLETQGKHEIYNDFLILFLQPFLEFYEPARILPDCIITASDCGVFKGNMYYVCQSSDNTISYLQLNEDAGEFVLTAQHQVDFAVRSFVFCKDYIVLTGEKVVACALDKSCSLTPIEGAQTTYHEYKPKIVVTDNIFITATFKSIYLINVDSGTEIELAHTMGQDPEVLLPIYDTDKCLQDFFILSREGKEFRVSATSFLERYIAKYKIIDAFYRVKPSKNDQLRQFIANEHLDPIAHLAYTTSLKSSQAVGEFTITVGATKSFTIHNTVIAVSECNTLVNALLNGKSSIDFEEDVGDISLVIDFLYTRDFQLFSAFKDKTVSELITLYKTVFAFQCEPLERFVIELLFEPKFNEMDRATIVEFMNSSVVSKYPILYSEFVNAFLRLNEKNIELVNLFENASTPFETRIQKIVASCCIGGSFVYSPLDLTQAAAKEESMVQGPVSTSVTLSSQNCFISNASFVEDENDTTFTCVKHFASIWYSRPIDLQSDPTGFLISFKYYDDYASYKSKCIIGFFEEGLYHSSTVFNHASSAENSSNNGIKRGFHITVGESINVNFGATRAFEYPVQDDDFIEAGLIHCNQLSANGGSHALLVFVNGKCVCAQVLSEALASDIQAWLARKTTYSFGVVCLKREGLSISNIQVKLLSDKENHNTITSKILNEPVPCIAKGCPGFVINNAHENGPTSCKRHDTLVRHTNSNMEDYFVCKHCKVEVEESDSAHVYGCLPKCAHALKHLNVELHE